MSGHVFHPGHHTLHGITVLLETSGSVTYIGRFDSEDDSGVHLLDVAMHDAADPALSKDEFVRRTLKYGVAAARKHVLVPATQVRAVRPLNKAGG